MPDIISIGLGGGSLIRDNGNKVGPDSVGYRLTEKALVFGGDTLTATDIAVKHYDLDIGDKSLLNKLDDSTVKNAKQEITRLLEEAVDKMKTSAENVPAVFVGGGTILNKENLNGISELVIPDNFAVANAVGAATVSYTHLTLPPKA